MYRSGIACIDDDLGGLRRDELTVVLAASRLSPAPVFKSIVQACDCPVLIFTAPDSDLGAIPTDADVYIDVAGHRAFATIADRATRACDALGIGLVIIEDLQHLHGARSRDMDLPLRQEIVTLPKTTGAGVVVGWVSEWERQQPRWSDIRGTAIEEPDLLVLLSRDGDIVGQDRVAALRCDGSGLVTGLLDTYGIA